MRECVPQSALLFCALLGTKLMAVTVRPVAMHDLALICEHRARMFAESARTRESLRPMTAAQERSASPSSACCQQLDLLNCK